MVERCTACGSYDDEGMPCLEEGASHQYVTVPAPPPVPPGQHDWRNWETCRCGQRGCNSYRPFVDVYLPEPEKE